MLIMQLMLDWT